ncbi:potassium uptake TrkH family protein [Thermocatellispora tengchongensis]|uniref:Potassium uptake TrkH family protein n=2 Tax=Thermocatellispora tengchongensis TaxID=1073253 RepID=A0A840P8K3_9ACTN|nr:potassium uptake TrkH family protein [Thermocatellispora tengchongensis]
MRRDNLARALLDRVQHPTQMVALGFGLAVLAGSLLLSLPVATTTGEPAGWLTALFTATSAVCVTGLIVVDTPGHWSAFGEVVIALLIQIGGLGIMTMATLLTLLISGRLGLRARLLAQTETKSMSMQDVRRVLGRVVVFSLVCEAAVAAVLTARFLTGYGEPPGRALYLGVFHAISAFNNAGFALWPDNLMGFVTDPWICLPIAVAVILGGLGFPVVFELLRSWRRPGRWTIVTRITVMLTVVLLLGGTLVFLFTEWHNPGTLGPLDGRGKALAAFFTAVMPRTAGFNSLDLAQLHPSSLLATDVLMFIGGGTAGTAGGIKVTTLGLVGYIVWAELRAESRVNVGHRRLAESAQRQTMTLITISAALVVGSTYVLMVLTPHELNKVLFEVVSAFATVGLSTGITADIPAAGQVLLVLLMFVGRIGPLTLGSALALRERTRRYELPVERVVIG